MYFIAITVTNLSHDHVLTFLHIFPLCLNDGVQKVEVLNVAAMCGQTMDEMMQHRLADLRTELVIITENVLHCFCLEELKDREHKNQKREHNENMISILGYFKRHALHSPQVRERG